MIGDRFNANGRDCPRCYRKGTLEGVTPVYDGVRKFDCGACFARFRFEPETDAQPATLVQIPFDVQVSRCADCSARIGAGLTTCTPCNAARFRA